MKSLLLFVLCLSMSWTATSQDYLAKYAALDNVDGMEVTQNMFNLLAQIDTDVADEDVQHFLDVVGKLQSIKVLSTDDNSIEQKLKTDTQAYLKKSSLNKLMQVKEDGKQIKFYAKPGATADKISQLMMTITQTDQAETQFVLLVINGEIDLDDVSKLAGMLHHIPGANELKKVKTQ